MNKKELDLHDKNKLITRQDTVRLHWSHLGLKKEGPNAHPSGYVSGSSHHYRY